MYAKPKTNFGIRDMQRQEAFVKQFMRSVDVPDWYRGMSSFQLHAANNLQNAIRDDLEQGTTHRVRNVLDTIGLRPPISKTKARFVMRLSRGNDLAFLWFLKDLYYESEGPGYSLNEQLILSCIAHLDLIFTIRGLDGILPPEQAPKRKQKHYEARKLRNNIKLKLKNHLNHKSHKMVLKDRRTITVRKLYKLPYLDNQRLPQAYGKSLTLRPPDHVLHLKFLDIYKDPNYIVPNEFSRWFAKHNLNYGRQTASGLINENLDFIFKEDIVKIPSQVFEAQIFRDLRLSRHSSRLNVGTTMGGKIVQCEHHKFIDELERNLEHELRVIAREKCEKYLDVEKQEKEERIARLRQQIENDVNLHLGRFKDLADKSRSQLLLLSKENIHQYGIADPLNDNKENRLCGGEARKSVKKPQCRNILSECDIERKGDNCNAKRKLLCAKSENIIRSTDRKNARETEIIGDCLNNNNTRKSSKQHIPPILETKQRRSCRCCHCKSQGDLCDTAYDYIQNYDYGHSEASTGRTKAFFNAPNKHRPFKFDYHKIFDLTLAGDQAADERVKRACVGAIKSDEILGVINSESKENVDAAIKNYALRTFKSQLKNRNEGNVEAEGTDSQKNFKYYDPDDRELMHRMLREALERLTKDTRYVLPTLPDAHKMPILRYWIYQRFGKVYSKTELNQIFQKSAQLFRAINKMTIIETLSAPRKLGRALYINYGCHDYLMRKTEYIRKMFYKRVDDSIMEQSRRLYMAMSPYLHTSESKTIFAYLPARPSDIHHFHVWNPRSYKAKSRSSIRIHPVGSMY